MSAAREALRRVRSEFENHGVRTEIQITEHVAFLLLIKDEWDDIRALIGVELGPKLQDYYDGLQSRHSSLRIPEPPPASQWGTERLIALLNALQEAINQSPHNISLGEFFQREVRYELLKGTTGSQYPTPHHIADMIASLAINQPAPDILDPTAGTAGLLVSTLNHAEPASLVGHDFDPIWAGIGSANLLLHDAQDTRFSVGSVLGCYEDYGDHYDSVVMNPPFGGSRGATEVANTVGNDFGRGNASVLTALAMHTLKPGGQGAFLIPSGILSGSGTDASIRRLLTENRLEAIVTFPRDAFQPYSQTEAHLIAVRKKEVGEPRPTDPIWFCKIERDGYPSGAGRDLSEEPIAETNELPRVRDLILQARNQQWVTNFTCNDTIEIQTLQLNPDNGLRGIAIRTIGDPLDVSWDTSYVASGLLVKVRDTQSKLKGWLHASLDSFETVSMLPSQVGEHEWKVLLPTSAWADPSSIDWSADKEDVSLAVGSGDERHLILKQGRNRTYKFVGAESTLDVMACLLDEAGKPLSPWLAVENEQSQDRIVSDQFADDLGALPIHGGSDTRVGWLVSFQSNVAEGEAQSEQHAFLLIVDRPNAELYSDSSEGGHVVALLDSGWLRFNPLDESGALIETGTKIQFRDGIKVEGFAVGPSPDGPGYSLFAVLISRSEFEMVDDTGMYAIGDLRPSRFLPEPKPGAAAHPSDVLAEIRKSQTKLAAKIDTLLGVLGGIANPTNEVIAPDWLLEMLNDEQQRFWRLLRSKEAKDKPRHFNVMDVVEWCKEDGEFHLDYQEDDVNRQIALLLRLGLILEVHSRGQNLYRIATEGDSAGFVGDSE